MSLKLLSIAAVVIGLAYYLYIPIHEDIHDKTALRALIYSIRITKVLSYASEALGLDTYINTEKKILNYMIGDSKAPEIEGLETEDYSFDSVPVRLYRSTSSKKPAPCVIYFHGGGWTFQSVDAYDEVVADLALETGYVFISVDYRLAPEHPFPIPFEDSYTATLHLMKNARKYGVDPKRIGLSGDSAGGNLAAAVSLKLRNVKDVTPLRFQWLIYPALQAVDFKLPSYISNKYATPHFLQPMDMAQFYCYYLGIPPTEATIALLVDNRHISKDHKSRGRQFVDYRQLPVQYQAGYQMPSGSENDNGGGLSEIFQKTLVDPYFAPLMAQDLTGMPPTFVVTAEHDVLRDDGMLFSERLRKSGVDVVHYNSRQSTHMFMYWTALAPRYSDTNNTIAKFVKFAAKYFK